MLPKKFSDPLGSKLPALEQNILKFRAMQMLLVMFYAEELKHDVLNLNRVPKGTKNAVDKALSVLVTDRAITAAEKTEIVGLIDYRNVIGHHMHNLLADISSERIAREMVAYAPDLLRKYNYDAVGRLQYLHRRLDGLYRTHHYVTTGTFNRLLFRSAEKTFLAEIKRLDRKISRLTKSRRAEIEILNSELALEGTEFEGDLHPRDPLNQYDDGRLTRRRVEICYRLFDMGKSTMAVAHLTGLSLISASKRQRMWTALGGENRMKEEIAAIPHRKFYARYDD